MAEREAEIAIIGAGPAGAHLASKLAAAGCDAVLFDPKGAWEKPCGGGVPTRALREFQFILESADYPRKLINRVTLISPLERRVSLTLLRPFAIYSREVFNGMVLDRALAAGARFIRKSVVDSSREDRGWRIRTDDGETWSARFLVGADGAASATRRRLIGIFPKTDLALAFGYNVGTGDGDRDDEVVVRFPRNFTGYLWAFPRPGVMNFGVASKLGEKTSDQLRALLRDFIRDYYGGELPQPERMTFFGAKIPTLEAGSWKDLKSTGNGWALVGDAAGFVDPITGEGIYYALKSADLLAEALLQTTESPNRYSIATADYSRRCREVFGKELEKASQLLPRFYHGLFLGRIFTDATIRLARYHRGVRGVLADLIVGEQSYLNLKRDLLRQAYRVF